MNPDTAMFAFGALCAGIGALTTSMFWFAALDRERAKAAASQRLRDHVARTTWTEAKW